METLDPYSITNKLDEAAIASVTTRLEARGEDPFFQNMLDEYIAALDPARLKRVLEVGCGTGVATRALANHPSFTGHIDASDLSEDLIATAIDLAERDGCAGKVSFTAQDALAVSAEGTYDAVIAHTVISHVPAYEAFLAGLAKAVAKDGTIVMFDGDYASTTLGAEDPADGERLSQAIINGMIVNPRIMQQMPWIAANAGLKVRKSFSYLLSEIGSAGFFADMLPSLPVLLPRTGQADETTTRRWVEQQKGYARDGTFFGAVNFYTYMLRKT